MTGLLRSVFAAAPLNLCGMLAQRMRFAPLTCHGIFTISMMPKQHILTDERIKDLVSKRKHLQRKSVDEILDEFVDYIFSVSETNLNVDVIDAYLTVLDEKDPLSFKIDIENTLRAFKENSKSKHDSTLSDRLISDTHILIR